MCSRGERGQKQTWMHIESVVYIPQTGNGATQSVFQSMVVKTRLDLDDAALQAMTWPEYVSRMYVCRLMSPAFKPRDP